MKKHWVISKPKYIALLCVLVVLIAVAVLFIPAYTAKLFDNLPRENQNFVMYLDFVDVFIAICLILFIVVCVLALFFCILFYFRVFKPKVMEITCYVIAGVVVLLFIASVIALFKLKDLQLGAGVYLLWLWAAIMVVYGLFVRPAV